MREKDYLSMQIVYLAQSERWRDEGEGLLSSQHR